MRAIGGLALVVGLVVAGIQLSSMRRADVDALRWAVFGAECPKNPGDQGYAYARQNCYELRSISCGAKSGCLCQTDRPELNGEIDADSMPDCAYRRVGICRWRDPQGEWINSMAVRPVGWTPPAGYTCSLIANRVLVTESRANQRSELESALEEKCGWPVSGDSWACCPHCLIWGANGCPPCRALCKYGNSWPGHEAECGGAL